MAIKTLIIYVVVLILLGIAYKVLKSMFKWVAYIAAVLWILGMVVGVMVYSDATDLKEKFADSEKLFLLEVDGDIETGFHGVMKEKEQPVMLSEEQISKYDEFYDKEEYSSMLGTYYKMFIVNNSAFDDLESVNLGEQELEKEVVFEILQSDDAAAVFSEEVGGKVSMSDSELKGNLFGALIMESMEKEGSIYIVRQIHDGNIRIYPETAMFKFVKYIPISLVNDIGEVVNHGDT